MNAYIMLTIADVLLAANFVFQKKYQGVAGTSLKAGLIYNALTGFFSALMFLIINRFEIRITGYSLVMASIFACVLMLYIFIGFRIMENGSMALYTLFLMSGGMTVPYIYGVLFLNEGLTILRTLGLVAIIAAIIISNSGDKKLGKKQLLFCSAVFFLNGISSVTSKLHQINPVSQTVTSSDFAFIVMMFKIIICSGVMLLYRKRLFSVKSDKIYVKSVIGIIVLAALSDGLTYMLQLIGATKLPATVLYPFVTGGSVILTSFAGALVFKERLLTRQKMAVAICFVGTLLFL